MERMASNQRKRNVDQPSRNLELIDRLLLENNDDLAQGEFLAEDYRRRAIAKGKKVARRSVALRLDRLVEKGELKKRKVFVNGRHTNAYSEPWASEANNTEPCRNPRNCCAIFWTHKKLPESRLESETERQAACATSHVSWKTASQSFHNTDLSMKKQSKTTNKPAKIKKAKVVKEHDYKRSSSYMAGYVDGLLENVNVSPTVHLRLAVEGFLRYLSGLFK
jgi:hypothetical protein